ncbi:MAG: protein-disulfide reductase DsbD domain-containing protein, partial [Limisphaerales bacterium]
MRNGILALTCCCLFALAVPRAGAAATKIELLLDKDSVRPGEPVLAGLRMTMAPNWHTYWRNGGDVGFPTKITLDLPNGMTTGEIQWPVPHKYFTNTLTSYEYATEAVLFIPLKIAAGTPAGSYEVTAKASWLECETGSSCVPAKGSAKATLLIGAETRPSAAAPLLAAAQKLLPTTKSGLVAGAAWEKPAAGDTRPLLIEWSATARQPDFFPYSAENFEVVGPTEILRNADGKIL